MISVTLTANDGKGGTVQNTFTVTVAPLETIQDLRFTSSGPGFEAYPRFNWTAAKGATSITIMLSTDGGATWNPATIVSGGGSIAPTATFAQLGLSSKPTPSYQVKLVVVGGRNAGDSNIVTNIQ